MGVYFGGSEAVYLSCMGKGLQVETEAWRLMKRLISKKRGAFFFEVKAQPVLEVQIELWRQRFGD